MILQENVPSFVLTETGDIFEFALCFVSQEILSASLKLKHFHTVQPVLYVFPFHEDSCMVPLADRLHLLVRSRDEVIERCARPISVDPEFCIRMLRIIQDLILQTFGGTRGFRLGFDHEVPDSAIGTVGDLEINQQFEIAVFIDRNDIAAEGGFTSPDSLTISIPSCTSHPFFGSESM